MPGPVREENLTAAQARSRLAGLAAEYVGPSRHGGEVYYVASHRLYALVRRKVIGTWIGYFQDRSSCGC